METLEEIALVFKEVLVNKPFKKEEQIDLFTKLAISNFENIERKQFPCDEFYDWWTEIGGPRAGNKQDKRVKTKREKEEFCKINYKRNTRYLELWRQQFLF